MILHCTQKLAKKLPDVSKGAHGETSPLGSWHANLYTIDRHNCVLFCHDATRYTVFIPGLRKAQFVELGRWLKEAFLASLAYMGMEDNPVHRAELALGPVQFDTVTRWLCHYPVDLKGKDGYWMADKAMKECVGAL